MEKIKSALDLAMERTADLEAIKEIVKENPESEHGPYLKASSLLAESFLKGGTALEKVIATINRYPESVREKAACTFLLSAAAEMKLENCAEVAAAYRHFRRGEESGLVEDLEKLDRDFQEQLRKLREEVESGKYRELLLEPLYRDGISGTALAGVNPERSPWWQEQLAGLAASRTPDLARLKEKLLASLDQK